MSIIVVGCVANSRADTPTENVCGFNKNEGACSFSTLVGVVGFLLALICVVIEAQWERLGSYHRYIYLGELITAGVWALLFFIVFCMLASDWSATDSSLKSLVSHGNANVAIAASFFSVISWGALAYFSYKGYKEDDMIGGMERLGGYMDPVTSSYHQGSTI